MSINNTSEESIASYKELYNILKLSKARLADFLANHYHACFIV